MHTHILHMHILHMNIHIHTWTWTGRSWNRILNKRARIHGCMRACRYFAAHDPTIRWLGLDGGEGVERATNYTVKFADLAAGLPAFVRRRKWDWVMSIEVAEHVPAGNESRFVHNVVSQAQKGVVLSWAKRCDIGFQ